MNAVRDDAGALIGYERFGVTKPPQGTAGFFDGIEHNPRTICLRGTHDLQEPLRTMSVHAQLLSRRYTGKLDADADQFLAFISRHPNRMSSLVEAC